MTSIPMRGGIRGTARIGVLGGGIAGLTTAVALRNAGLDCVVFEQAPRVETAGLGLQITPNASRLLASLGVGDAVDAVATRPLSIDVHRWDGGRRLARTPLGDACVESFGAPYYTMHRADLQQSLLRSLPTGTVRLGHRCVAVRCAPETVTAVFADGSEVAFDVLVGADGISSVARRAIADDLRRFSGQIAYRGLVPAGTFPEWEAEPRVRGWFGPSQHCVCYPVASDRFISFTAMTPDATASAPEDRTARPAASAGPARDEATSTASLARAAAAAYEGWDPLVLRLFRSAPTLGLWRLHDRDPLPRWSTSRLTLIGDAAHPMLPFRAQGANQAIEDAVVLSACLRQADDQPMALRRYEELRLPRTTRIQLSSRESAEVFHLGDGDRQLERDRDMPERWALRNNEWLFGYRAESAALS
ncbi:FAD-dependent monooxygenase [Streptomyces antimycoticus]|uniref:FAD-dependent monooxygenase n=1 Tax=Streptomyces antimycoticus TaxID=68175 RepID=UPI001EED7FB6|nr:FAD-dependent monooxygenase [Streptomyces antimycoticus]